MPPQTHVPLVPKPRSLARLIEWLPGFAAVDGDPWLDEGGVVEGTRDAYLEATDRAFEGNDHRANARMEVSRAQEFGFVHVDPDGLLTLTDAGRTLVEDPEDRELILRQLLKWQIPNPKRADGYQDDWRIHPVRTVFELFGDLADREDRSLADVSLTTYELAVTVFTCRSEAELAGAKDRLQRFRAAMERDHRRATGRWSARRSYEEHFEHPHRADVHPSPATFADYADTLVRALLSTALFRRTGRGKRARLRIAEGRADHVERILEARPFPFLRDWQNDRAWADYMGSTERPILPWGDLDYRRRLVLRCIEELEEVLPEADWEDERRCALDARRLDDLSRQHRRLRVELTCQQRERYVTALPHDEEARQELRRELRDLSRDPGGEFGAERLENLMWKGLVSIDSDVVVEPRFRLNPDLTTASVAPGRGPDIEYYGHRLFVPVEATLQTGAAQANNEVPSITDHATLYMDAETGRPGGKLEDHNPGPTRTGGLERVVVLFVCPSIHHRTRNMLVAFGGRSIAGVRVPCVPMTLEEFHRVVERLHGPGRTATDFEQLLIDIVDALEDVDDLNGPQWMGERDRLITAFLAA